MGEDEPVYRNGKWSLVLANEADYPGFCRVVWNEHVGEMTDLSEEDRVELMNAVWLAEKTVREVMQPDKINLASLGNMVPHLHWHIIPRYTNDRNFPDSIWSIPRREVDEKEVAVRKNRLAELRKAISDTFTEQYGLSRKL